MAQGNGTLLKLTHAGFVDEDSKNQHEQVQTIGETPKVFAYVTGDEQKVLKQYGLI